MIIVAGILFLVVFVVAFFITKKSNGGGGLSTPPVDSGVSPPTPPPVDSGVSPPTPPPVDSGVSPPPPPPVDSGVSPPPPPVGSSSPVITSMSLPYINLRVATTTSTEYTITASQPGIYYYKVFYKGGNGIINDFGGIWRIDPTSITITTANTPQKFTLTINSGTTFENLLGTYSIIFRFYSDQAVTRLISKDFTIPSTNRVNSYIAADGILNM